MKIQEIISEGISYSKYLGMIEPLIKNSIVDSFKKSSQDVDDFLEILQDDLIEKLETAAAEILPDQTVIVDFKKINTSGLSWVETPHVSLQSKNKITHRIRINKLLLDKISSKIFANSDTDLLDLLDRRDVAQYIDTITDTFIHEIVHSTQHTRQPLDPGQDPSYTSYLAKGNKFEKERERIATGGSRDRNYHRIYFASPQEIAAHAHNLVLEIIRKYKLKPNAYLTRGENLKNILSSVNVAKQKIPTEIADYLKLWKVRYQGYRDPQVQKVHKRYMKLVYQELDQYVKHITDELRN
jgi:hypothetical protein